MADGRRFSRRSFLTWLATAVPLAAFVRRAHAAAVDALSQDPSDTAMLQALGAAILPSEIGPGGQRGAVTAFQQWIAGYREQAELDHDYGASALQFSRPTPATRWAAQLAALGDAATRRFGRPFPGLTLEQRRELVRADLADQRGANLPSVSAAPHVALALLAHFYGSPEATDLCYRARIGRRGCRPLAQSPQEPQRLATVRR